MKKVILSILLFIMVIPVIVNAETCDNGNVNIKSIDLKEKTENVEELEKATFDNKKLDLNIKMNEVGDSITYKVLIENKTNEDYELDESNILLNSDYFKYSLDTNDKIIKANTEREIELRIVYDKEVDNSKFENGVYTDNQDLAVSLSNDNVNRNPITQTNYVIMISFILLVILIISYVIWKKKKNKQALMILLTVLFIPISVSALCKIDIEVESHVQIEKNLEFCVISFDYEYGDTLSEEYLVYYPYENNMTFGDYFNQNPDSDLLYKNDQGYYYKKLRLRYGFVPNVNFGNTIYFVEKEHLQTFLQEEFNNNNYNDLTSKIKPKSQGCYYLSFDDGLR